MKRFLSALLLAAPAHHAAAATVYSQDFENEAFPAEFTGAGDLTVTGGLSAFGFGQSHLHNPGTTATQMNLIGLGPHNSITLTFDLAVWDSVDIGDQFVVTADGVDLYNSTDFGNYFPSDNLGHGPGTLLTPAFGEFTVPELGQNINYRDSARHVTFTFPHTGENLTVTWAYPGSQTAPDESFGIDNVIVDTNNIPEPSVATLSALALATLLRRRQR